MMLLSKVYPLFFDQSELAIELPLSYIKIDTYQKLTALSFKDEEVPKHGL